MTMDKLYIAFPSLLLQSKEKSLGQKYDQDPFYLWLGYWLAPIQNYNFCSFTKVFLIDMRRIPDLVQEQWREESNSGITGKINNTMMLFPFHKKSEVNTDATDTKHMWVPLPRLFSQFQRKKSHDQNVIIFTEYMIIWSTGIMWVTM